MERIASEFNKLQYSVSHTTGHPLVEEVKPVRRANSLLKDNYCGWEIMTGEWKGDQGLRITFTSRASRR